MLNVYSSPGDPIFYLHHTYLDKLWWQWQAKALSTRLTDISGRNKGFLSGGGFPGFPGNVTIPPGNGACSGFPIGASPSAIDSVSAELVQSDGDPGNETTLNHVLTMFGMLPNVTIADVMDIQGGLLCYEYV